MSSAAAGHLPHMRTGRRAVAGFHHLDTGVVMATYRRAGVVERGSSVFERPTPEEEERRRRLADEAS
jgi:hypothetical protein